MADENFHRRSPPMSLGVIAEKIGAALNNPRDADFLIEDVAPLDTANSSQLAFLDNRKYREQFRASQAAACIVNDDMAQDAPQGMRLLVSATPYKSYAQAAALFYPSDIPVAGIDPTTRIGNGVKIGNNCEIGAYCVIADDCEIGDNTIVAAHVVIGRGVKIGQNCRISSQVTLSHCLIGDHVSIYPGARIGQDGFGFAIDRAGFVKVPQLGRVIIEGHSEIGANTTIDRGALGDTVIGLGTWIDNQVQIGHNVRLGKGCIVVSQVGISGSTEIGDYAMLGGQAGFAGHLKIGSMARIAAKSGVTRDVPAKEEWMGYPAMPMKQFLRHTGLLNRLIKKQKVNS